MAPKSSKTWGWILTTVGIAIVLLSNKIVFPGLEMLLGIETIVGKDSVSYSPDGSYYLFTNPGAMVKWVASVASIGLLVAVAGVILLLREKKRNQGCKPETGSAKP